MSDASRARFAELLSRRDPDLAEANLLIAVEAFPRLDVDRWLGRIGEIAERAKRLGGVAGVVSVLREAGLSGDRATYDDPRNAFLNEVLDRRTGLPITLAVLTVAVATRVGVPMSCVAMPGHVIVATDDDGHRVYLDPFDRWEELDVDRCQAIVRATAGVALDPAHLQAATAPTVIRRMLANLTGSYARREMIDDVRWTLELQAIVTPDDPEIAAQLDQLPG